MAYITIAQNVTDAARYLTEGRIVAFPTGTSYGLAADATQGWALQRLRNLKQRPAEKTFTVFMREELWDHFLILTGAERRLLKKMANQPLTLLVQPAGNLDHLAQDGLIGLRVIDHPLMQQLADATEVPLTATSANRTAESPCFCPADIERAFTNPLPDQYLSETNPRGASGTTYDLSLAAILDGGVLPSNPPTTIAKVDSGAISIVREGALSLNDLQF